MSSVANYIRLTKPTIILLVVVTGLVTLALQGFLFEAPIQSILICLAITAAAGSANAFNQIWERDLDAQMERTRNKRPLPLGQISVQRASIFAGLLGLYSTAYLWAFHNLTAALISLATILYYVLFYTAYLKKAHHYNIVIGGAAGAAAPLIAWAAVTGEVSTMAWILFAIIFMWTPPHFWALALAIKEDYEKIKMPMLPVARGVKRTELEIYLYTFSLLPISIAPYWFAEIGLTYVVFASLLWGAYLWQTFKRLRAGTKRDYKILFAYSILYLFFLFISLGIEGAFQYF